MAKQFDTLSPEHQRFIQAQKIYFVATAGCEGHVNLSPKGMDSLRIINDTTVRWLNLTGSGNETAAHVLENQRMTIMFCAFEEHPLIMRLYGKATTVHTDDENWKQWYADFPDLPGARQIFELKIDIVQTSCGFAVPFYDYTGERPTLIKWAEKKGQEKVEQYWEDTNAISLDGKPTRQIVAS
ncbi:MAG: pyridoxamine 5'-phosphate oxidase family protein [Ectothiorhodospiraceae bacterium]|nr:pyridoxamine 5'-phosphate oxidase family protein [Ectothiorhodospiraceae bacterium]